jgi:hypothetical protein
MKGYWKKDKVQQAQSLVDRIDDEIKQCGIDEDIDKLKGE